MIRKILQTTAMAVLGLGLFAAVVYYYRHDLIRIARVAMPVTEKEIHEQQYQHFSNMNNVLYQMPVIFSTILGGLWFFAASYLEKDRIISAGVFVFAAIAACCFVVALERFKLAFSGYIDNLNKLDGPYKVTLKPSRWPSTLSAMKFLVTMAAVISVLGAIYAAFLPHHAHPTDTVRVILGH